MQMTRKTGIAILIISLVAVVLSAASLIVVTAECILGIYEKDAPDVLTGLIELYDYKPTGKVVSVGCRLRPEYWGKGIATGSVLAMIDYLRSNTHIELITAHAIPDNHASGNNLIKNGFQYLHTKTEDWGLEEPTVSDVYTYDC